MKPSGTVESLFVYPVKSCQGQALKEMTLSHEGPQWDRQWMLVDEKGQFLTQRTLPKMATIQVLANESGLSLGLGKQFFVVPKNNSFKRLVKVKVWSDELEAGLEADLFSQAISQYLGVNCRLVRYAPTSPRPVGKETDSPWKPETRFTDRKPVLIVGTKSLADLNSRLETPVAMDRFRANIVVTGFEAFAEEEWSRVQVGSVVFSQKRKCSRCKIINTDQKTGEVLSAEPLKTLSTYRRDGANKINFGTLWIPENPGVIHPGDSVQILS